MSHSRIREDKRCQNCGRFVAERFCPNCGQENVENRRRFHYLFVHFFEDFVHYDSLFWKTIKSLFFPAKLTKEYLAGKRKSQVSPVQLYIFISFVVFFIPVILPDFNNEKPHSEKKKPSNHVSLGGSIAKDYSVSMFGLQNVKSVEELDSIQQTLPKEKKLWAFQYVLFKKNLALKQMENPKEKIIESLMHNLPKAVFLYMPVFAFWLWLFHNKKKWLYFDHGIYTLHFFSFILLVTLIYIMVHWALSIFHKGVPWFITSAMSIYLVYYFFHSHRRMYMNTKAVSRLLCTTLLFVNTFCLFFFMVIFLVAVVWISAAV